MRTTPHAGPSVEEFHTPARGGPGRAADHRAADRAEGPVARELAGLLDRAAGLDVAEPVWHELTIDAARVTAELAAAGRIGRHLVAAPTDPPAVVARLLAAAWRATRDALPCRGGGRRGWASIGTADG
jgi:hypothetical protein